MNRELIYGLIGVTVVVAAIAFALGPPVLHQVVKNWRAKRMVQPVEELTDGELAQLRLTGDVDTKVIGHMRVNKALGRVGGVSPTLRRTEIQPRRHRSDPALDTPRRPAELARHAAVEPPR
jgi:hypothetical protein